MASRTTGKLLRRKPDGAYESFSFDGSTTAADANLSPETAKRMWAQGGFEEVEDTDFEALRRLAYGQPDPAEADFRAGASKAMERKPGYAQWAEDDFRQGAPKVSLLPPQANDATMDGASNPQARMDMTAMDGPRNPNPMPRAGMKTGPKRPGIAVGMPAADRAAAGRLPPGLQVPAAATRALQAPQTAVAGRAADPYGDARAAAGRNRLGVQLARAGAMVNEGLSGARYDRGAYDDLEAQADAPVADFAARRGMAREDAATAAEAEARRLRAEDYARTWRRQESQDAYGRERDKVGDTFARERLASEERRAREANAARYADREEARKDRLFRQQQALEERTERGEAARAATQAGQREKSLAQLAERSQPAAEMRADIDTVNDFIKRGGNDFDALPGVGPVQGLLPEFLRSTDGDRLFQSANRLAANVILAKSGKAATDAERKVLLANYGIRGGTTEEAFVAGMQSLARDAQDSLANIEAGYDESVVDTRRARGGTTSADIPQIAGPGPKPTGRRATRRDGTVWEELSDGTARRVK